MSEELNKKIPFDDVGWHLQCGMEIAYRNAISLFYAEKVK